LEQYRRSIENFEKEYSLQKVDYKKKLSAYNIACVYAKLNDTNSSIHWLEKISDKSRVNWKNWLEKELDFNAIRDDDSFQKYLRTF